MGVKVCESYTPSSPDLLYKLCSDLWRDRNGHTEEATEALGFMVLQTYSCSLLTLLLPSLSPLDFSLSSQVDIEG